jgi:glutamate transport system ATP-binding protein
MESPRESPDVPMVSMKAVNKHFGALHVLNDINLDVGKGQVVVVLGPSGSGKSTLCRTINRLETVDSAWSSSRSTCSRTRQFWTT